LKLKCDEPLSNYAFNFNVRRYMTVLTKSGTAHDSVEQDTKDSIAYLTSQAEPATPDIARHAISNHRHSF
jgi:hypothetical protein